MFFFQIHSKKRRRKPKIPPTPAYGQRKFVFEPNRYRNVQAVSPRSLEFSSPKTSNAHYNDQRDDDSGFEH